MLGLFLFTLVAVAMVAQAPLKVSMISLGVTDMDRSVKFYRDTLGLALMGQPGEVTVLRAGEIMIALNRPLGKASGDRIVGATEVIFPVESVTAAHADLSNRGCNFVTAPRELFPGTFGATFTDPDGHRLTILGPK